jgi:hypothetical protein
MRCLTSSVPETNRGDEMAISKEQAELMIEYLQQRGDAVGECDKCHGEPLELWEDTEHPGEFMYCKSCWRDMITRAKRLAADPLYAAWIKSCE